MVNGYSIMAQTEPPLSLLFLLDLDLSLSPSGKIVKKVGDSLTVKMEKNASGAVKESWSKVTCAGPANVACGAQI